jgi:probable addiction module antidote protein
MAYLHRISWDTLYSGSPRPALIAAALGDIACAEGMNQIALDRGLGRERLYKALSPKVIHNLEQS